MELEWDEAKAAVNLARHGVDFRDALHVFNDPLRLEYVDDRFDYGEDRYIAIGQCGAQTLYVTFCDRGQRTRLISARKAESYERRTYHESQDRLL